MQQYITNIIVQNVKVFEVFKMESHTHGSEYTKPPHLKPLNLFIKVGELAQLALTINLQSFDV